MNRLLIVVLSLLMLSDATLAQTYPSKVIKIVAPYTPGSPNDVMVRLLAQHAQQRLGQTHQGQALGAGDGVFAQQRLHRPERRRVAAHLLHPRAGHGDDLGPVQRAADAGSLAAASTASSSLEEKSAVATRVFFSNLPAEMGGVTPTVSTPNGTIVISASYAQPTAFMKIAGFDSITVRASATAAASSRLSAFRSPNAPPASPRPSG